MARGSWGEHAASPHQGVWRGHSVVPSQQITPRAAPGWGRLPTPWMSIEPKGAKGHLVQSWCPAKRWRRVLAPRGVARAAFLLTGQLSQEGPSFVPGPLWKDLRRSELQVPAWGGRLLRPALRLPSCCCQLQAPPQLPRGSPRGWVSRRQGTTTHSCI